MIETVGAVFVYAIIGILSLAVMALASLIGAVVAGMIAAPLYVATGREILWDARRPGREWHPVSYDEYGGFSKPETAWGKLLRFGWDLDKLLFTLFSVVAILSSVGWVVQHLLS